jgi:hypothetical protein
MSLRLSEILEHDAPHLGITTRKHLTAFYDVIVHALRQGELTPEGGALPTTLNILLALLPGEHAPLKRDKEMTDWSVENDAKYATFLDRWRSTVRETPKQGRKVRAIAAPLHQAVIALQKLEQRSPKKAELEGAVRTFLEVYALSQHALNLPDIDRPIPTQVPAGIALDETKVKLGESKGIFVGLLRRTNAEVQS